MSGGSFGYAYRGVERFAGRLEERLRNAGKLSESPYGNYAECQWSPEVTELLTATAYAARKLATMMHAAEWLYSGDDGEESYLDAIAELDKDD